MRPRILLLAVMTLALGVGLYAQSTASRNLSKIELPAGFEISIFRDNVDGARSLARGQRGTIFVGTRREGKVYALVDSDGDGTAETSYTLLSGLRQPNGVAFRDGSLYVAEISRVLRLDGIENRLADPPKPVVVRDDLPTDGHHGWKYIAFGPDGRLYIPVGAPCNICDPSDWRYAAILRMMPDGSGLELFASGIRNTVGFDWHPESGELWFTDNGRDLLGDDLPPDELNRAPTPGLHFGYPYLHGNDVRDPQFWDARGETRITRPVQELGPHVASLGMDFYESDLFPEEYRGSVFIAEHGSWNRSTPIGYRITRVNLEGNRAVSYEVFAEGWLQGRLSWGRPVDVLELPDGSLLVSDDKGDAVYRISYTGS